MKSLSGKVTVITGAGSGLGRSLALTIAAEGGRVAAVDKDESAVREAAMIAQKNGRECEPFTADVSSREDMQALANQVFSKYGKVDLLICAAGVGLGGRCHEFSLDDWKLSMDVNLWGNIHGVYYFLPDMVKRKEGHIVSISSGGGLFGTPHTVPYNTAKFALVGLFESLGIEAAKYKVHVTTVCPTWMKTRFVENSRIKTDGRRDERTVRATKWLYDHFAIEPEKAARKIIRSIKKNKALVLIGRETYITFNLKKFFPGLYRRMMSFISRFM